MTAPTIDLADPNHRLDPFPTYRRLRDEAPVHHVPEGTWDGEDYYVLSRYEDVFAVLRDRKRFSSHINRGGAMDIPMMVNRDAPEHTRLRHMANKAFHARLVRTLSDWVQETVDDLVGEVLAQDRVEFVEAFTTELPLRVVGGMLGIPLDRKADMRRWSQAVMDGFSVSAGMDPALAPGFYEDVLEFGDYMGELAAGRRGRPNREDILGELVVQQDAGDLTRDELVVMAWSFVAAGHETTMNLLGGGIRMLLEQPGLAARLSRDPDRSLDFMEEYLRLYSPTQWLLRRTMVAQTIQGVDLPEGALLHTVIGSANRDPRKFDRPEEFDLDRKDKLDHLAFGAGQHFCPGSALSRLLATTTFRTFYPILDRLALDPADPPRLRLRQGSYGIAHMPIVVKS